MREIFDRNPNPNRDRETVLSFSALEISMLNWRNREGSVIYYKGRKEEKNLSLFLSLCARTCAMKNTKRKERRKTKASVSTVSLTFSSFSLALFGGSD